jgi:hydrogenase-4 component B
MVRAALVVQALGLASVGVAGAVCLFAGRSLGSGFVDGFDPAVGADPLSGAFLVMVAVVGVPAAVYAVDSLEGTSHPRAIAALTGVFPLTLVGVLVARDASLFLGSWELMTLVPAAAILVAHGDAAGRRTVFEYLAITHIGGAGVWVAVLLLAREGALSDPSALAGAPAGVAAVIAVAGLIGFGTKAGLVPLHSWLPRAHPVAPSHISAVMSGVMVKVAVYGLVRLALEWLDGPPPWVGMALLALGGLSALVGVLYALFQRDLKRLLAFSTIENVGIVVLGLGAAALFAGRGEDAWASLALAAALLHALNHAVFKALLFLGAGSIDRSAGGLDLDRLGGVLRRMPWTGPAVLVGALAIAGLPVLNGFASEWVTLQSLLGLGRQDALGVALGGGLAVAALGATAGLAAMCFAKVIGLVLLGAPRTPRGARAEDVGRSMRLAVVALAAACVALGLAPGSVLPSLAALGPGEATPPGGAGLSVAGTSLPTLAVAVALAAAVALLVLARGRRTAAPAPVWVCGQPPDDRLAWTSAAFTKPVLLTLSAVLRPEREVDVVERGGVVWEVRHRGAVPHLFDGLLYGPAVRLAMAGAAATRRLQSGSLRMYIAYLVGLVTVLLALARLGALG